MTQTNRRNTSDTGGYFIGVSGFKIDNGMRTEKMNTEIYYPFNDLPKINRGFRFNLILRDCEQWCNRHNVEGRITVNETNYIIHDGAFHKIVMNSRRTNLTSVKY